jgi:TRAP-type C4-dicarboxylate transport system permease small subunit
MAGFERLTTRLVGWFGWGTALALALLLCVSVVDVVASKLFSWPVPGSIDIIGLLAVLAVAFGMAKTEMFARNIRVDFLVMRLPAKIQNVCGVIDAILGFILWAFVIWSSLNYTILLHRSNEGSPTLVIPYYPFAFAIAVGCVPLLMVLVYQLMGSITALRKGQK